VHGIDVEERAVSGGRAESIQERSLHNVEEFKVIDNYLMIRLPDEIDHHKSVDISTKADRYIMNKKVGNVVFDFERTTFMDSSGIGIILGRYKKIACFGGKVYAINADNRIRRILLLSGLQNIVEIISN
jgi:stage II sporulation protein AA (anti-sigma F factor antagonist)